jgi:serine/threonine-protein kinase
MQSAGDIVAGKYRLERELDRGGMGSVWVARHLELDAPVALKFVRQLPDEARALVRFKREARAAALLRGPHIVHVHDYGTDGGIPYLAMELLKGETLRDRLEREGRCSRELTVNIAVQVGKAMKVAHDEGVVHRDIKPSNLFFARWGDEEVLKVLDFGIAKYADAQGGDTGSTTSFGAVIGTPSYMSPEQARGDDVDLRSDLWSLAVVLYRSLVGREPFVGANAAQVVARICTQDFTPPSRQVPDLDRSVDAFFARAFALSPQQRFASADELVSAFVSAVAERSVAPSTPVRSASAPAIDATLPSASAPLAPAPSVAAVSVRHASTAEPSVRDGASVPRTPNRRFVAVVTTTSAALLAALLVLVARGEQPSAVGGRPAAAPSVVPSAPATVTALVLQPELAPAAALPSAAPSSPKLTSSAPPRKKASPSASTDPIQPLGSIDPVFGLRR